MDEKEIRSIAKDAADRNNIDLTKITVTDPPTSGKQVTLIKHVGNQEHAVEVNLDQAISNNASFKDIAKHQLDISVRSMKESLQDHYKVGDHSLIFENYEGEFYAHDQVTGYEWTIDVEHRSVFTTSPQDKMPNSPPDMVMPEMPEHLATTLKMYVIGWALETDVGELREELPYAGPERDRQTTERFKYLPEQ